MRWSHTYAYAYIFVFAFLPLVFPRSIYAQKVYKISYYKFTDAQEFYGTPYLINPFFQTGVSINFKPGSKAVLSGNPDGTGDMDVEEGINISESTGNMQFRYSAECTHKRMPPLDISYLMWSGHFQAPSNISLAIGIKSCPQFRYVNGKTVYYADISPIYLVLFEDQSETPTPFLDLPWDYVSEGKSFAEASMNMSSYFDHEYPLLSVGYVMGEPNETHDSLVPFFSSDRRSKLSYSSHDGYDWALHAGAAYGTPVRAAAAGIARYINSCGPCGNAVHCQVPNSLDSMSLSKIDRGHFEN